MKTNVEIYDWLRERGVRDPAVLLLGTRHVIGRWERVGEILESGYICRAGNVAICVLGEGDTLKSALDMAITRLESATDGQVSKPLS